MTNPYSLGPWLRRFLEEHLVSERNLAPQHPAQLPERIPVRELPRPAHRQAQRAPDVQLGSFGRYRPVDCPLAIRLHHSRLEIARVILTPRQRRPPPDLFLARAGFVTAPTQRGQHGVDHDRSRSYRRRFCAVSRRPPQPSHSSPASPPAAAPQHGKSVFGADAFSPACQGSPSCPQTVGHFPLPASAWSDDYYPPLQDNVTAFRKRHRDAPDAQELADQCQHEIDIWHAYSQSYGYEFLVLRVRCCIGLKLPSP